MKKWSLLEWLRELVLLGIASVMMILGVAMIMIPAPPSFEILTLYYLNPQDGITVTDLLSLILALCGLYIFLSVLIRMGKNLH